MRVTTNEVTYIHSTGRLVAEQQVHRQIARILCFFNIQFAHSYKIMALLLSLALAALMCHMHMNGLVLITVVVSILRCKITTKNLKYQIN